MKIIFAALLFSAASAMPANSRIGRSLIESARVLKQNEVDTTWMVNYTVHFDKCHAVTQVYGSNGQQGGNNKNNNNQATRVFTQYMAEFSVCPVSSSCKSGCSNGGKYIIDLGYFAQSYVEGKQEANKVACQTAAQNCAYDDVTVCYANAGLEFCNNENNNNNNKNNFNIQDYMQCQALENKNNQNNNNNNNGNYYAYTQ